MKQISIPKLRLSIVVTVDDIDNGIRGQQEFCPVAFAVRRALQLPTDDDGTVAVGDGDDRRIEVLTDLAEDGDEAETTTIIKDTYQLSEPGGTFIRNFDAGKKVRPATFHARHIRRTVTKS